MASVEQWSTLPREPLLAIADKLGPKIGLLRLRSVCSSWRSSLSPPLPKTLSFPLTLPPLFHQNPNPKNPNPTTGSSYSLTRTTLYRLSPPAENPNSGWLVKLKESTYSPTTFSLLNPLTTHPIDTHQSSFPKLINLLDYSISHVANSYTIERVDIDGKIVKCTDVTKVAAAGSSFTEDGGDFAVMALFNDGILGFWKLGQESWIVIEISGLVFDDVIFHKGKFYAVDWKGNLMMIDCSPLSLMPVRIAHALHRSYERRKCLVECNGELLAVDIINDIKCMDIYMGLHLRVLAPNRKDNFWDFRENLGGRSLFLGEDVTFSLLAEDFMGVEGDCVYFLGGFSVNDEEDDVGDGGDGDGDGDGCCCRFELNKKRVLRKLGSPPEYDKVELFWPPPSWLN